MKIDLKEKMDEVNSTYLAMFEAVLKTYGVSSFEELDEAKQETFLIEVDKASFKASDEVTENEEIAKEAAEHAKYSNMIQTLAKKSGKAENEVEERWNEAKKIADEQGDDDIDHISGLVARMLNIKESVPVVKAFAEKSGKSVPEVEKLWKEAKDQAAKEDKAEDYAYITGILKKMLKLESVNEDVEDYDYDDEANEYGEDYEEFDCHPTKLVALNALAMDTQVHLFHLNTLSYAQHMAFKDFYEEISDLADELIEKFLSMGYDLTLDDSNVTTFTFALTNDGIDPILRGFRDIVSEGLASTEDPEYASINDVMIDMQKLVDELLYKLTLN